MDYKHVCRFCKKSFPCGRSLGGHIRSHLIHNNTKNNKNSIDHAPNEGYELRENPKKTNKATKLLNSPPPPPPSWSTESEAENGDNPNLNNHQQNLARRSSFIGGNNSHSSVSEVVEPEQEEVAIAMCLIMLSKDVGNWGDISSSYVAEFSDNVSLLQANKTKRRSRRETIQGKDSVSGVAGNDHTKNKSKNFDSQASGYFQNGSKLENIKVSEDGFSLNDQNKKLSESKNSVSPADNDDTDKSKKLDYAASGQIQNGLKMKEIGFSRSGFASYDQSNKANQSKRKLGDFFKRKKKMESSGSGHVKNGSKMKEFEVSEDGSASNDQKMNDHELGFDENVGMSSELWNTNYKRSKFECTTCNKVFHSYQALGGHRASHKKLVGAVKGCPSPVSKLEGSEIANGDDFVSPPHDHHHHHQRQHEHQQQQQVVARIEIGSSTTIPSSKKVIQKHECPICFRVFPSGQALGGHKRSHLLAVNNSNNSEKPETRDLLDLNLPPEPAEEETTAATTIPAASSSNSLVELIKPYWWVETAKHEAILGLISN